MLLFVSIRVYVGLMCLAYLDLRIAEQDPGAADVQVVSRGFGLATGVADGNSGGMSIKEIEHYRAHLVLAVRDSEAGRSKTGHRAAVRCFQQSFGETLSRSLRHGKETIETIHDHHER